MFKNRFNITINRFVLNSLCAQRCAHKVFGRRSISTKGFSLQSSEQLRPQMSFTAKSVNANQNEDIYSEKHIPPQLLRPGQAIWRFKSYFSQLNPKRPPRTAFDQNTSGLWLIKLHIIEPKEMVFSAKSQSKRMAETIAMAKSLLWLRDNNFMDHSFTPIWTTDHERKRLKEKTSGPIQIASIDENLKYDINSYIESFNKETKEQIINICQPFDKIKFAQNCGEVLEESVSGDNDMLEKEALDLSENYKTIDNYVEPDEYELYEREEALKLHVEQRKAKQKTDKSFAELRRKVAELPIVQLKEQIIETIQQNRVTVISGDTGSGKTTQVPQYIFDNEIDNERGSYANIIVTQPRRISAISISERVALEYGEENIGNSIGYHVRFDNKSPIHKNGSILFCTAGILLRKLERNPKLKGVSHVIIDEVHERDVIIDFLLVLLRRILELNPDIRIILMSASMNANLFVEYFDSCPLIEIPGRCFPVEQLYLTDFIDKIGKNYLSQGFASKNPKIDKQMIVSLIDYINRNKSDGAILCFLPGWADIQNVFQELTVLNEKNKDLLVIPVHSKLPHEMQKQIFAKTPVGVRKVILATNIAETSLTIDDVVYVIDPGLANEMRYNSNLNVSAFGTHWISKANARQRSGRAGRVKAGQCYRLYPKEIENTFMDEFPRPELLRIPLENVVMKAKLHCPNEEVEKFLSEVPQSPSSEAIKSAINSLKEIKVIDSKENLTILGKRIVEFTTHPRLSVALVYSSMFGCLTSMLSLVSQLSANREPFHVMPDEKAIVREIKNKFSFDMLSDHISMVNITSEYQNTFDYNRNELSLFCNENHLNRYAMNNILELKKLFASHLEDSNFITKNSWRNFKSDANLKWHRKQLLIASLVPALVPNYVRLLGGELKNTKINWNKIVPIDVNSGKKVKFSSQSILSSTPNRNQVEKVANSIVLYFGSFFSQESRMLTICDASVISPISLLLFCDIDFAYNCENVSNLKEDECVVMLRNNKHLQFKINKQDLELIAHWNQIMNLFSQWFVIPKSSSDKNIISQSLKQFIELTDDLLNCSPVNDQEN